MPVSRKTSIYFAIELSLRGNFLRCVRARANVAKIVRSGDALCNTEELP